MSAPIQITFAAELTSHSQNTKAYRHLLAACLAFGGMRSPMGSSRTDLQHRVSYYCLHSFELPYCRYATLVQDL